ncbi:DUF1707 domain-containing protein [Mycolicibacterium neoaurum]|nr:DUF1707 domain-containing protein [Mycolicibacterium neoaurum]QVI28481.1 DUF1707 domain-containing protein [Mycolicibacterium neoaurum]
MAARFTGRTRAKDSDRDATCALLDAAHSEGQLSMVEHQERIAAAMAATTLGDLDDLTADLQHNAGPRAEQERRRPHRTRNLVIAGAAAVVGLGVLGTLVFSGSRDDAPPEDHPLAATPEVLIPPPVTTGAVPAVDEPPPLVLNLPRYMNTVEGMTGLLEEIRTRFGSTMGYELAFNPGRAYLAVPDPTGEKRLLYTFQGGWGEPSSRARSDGDDLTDLAAFDVPAAVAAWNAAPATLGIAPTDVMDTYLDVDHVSGPDGGPGGLELLVRVSTDGGTNGYIYLDPAGTVLRIEKPS